MTVQQTKTDVIRSLGHLSSRQIADLTGIKLSTVQVTRSRDKKIEHYRAIANKRYRETYQLSPSTLFWRGTNDAILIRMIQAGKTFTEVAEAIDASRSAVAGRVYRLRRRGIL
jgi:hypothetical protein